MTNNNDDEPNLGDEFGFRLDKIAMEELSKPLVVIVPLFKAFIAEGLNPVEAAAMTMAVITQGEQRGDQE